MDEMNEMDEMNIDEGKNEYTYDVIVTRVYRLVVLADTRAEAYDKVDSLQTSTLHERGLLEDASVDSIDFLWSTDGEAEDESS